MYRNGGGKYHDFENLTKYSTITYHQYVSRFDTDKDRTRKLLATIQNRGEISIWMIPDENSDEKLTVISEIVINGATEIKFLPYAGSPVLAIVVEENSQHRVQLWEIEEFEEKLMKGSVETKFQLKMLEQSKAGVHSERIQSMTCVRDIIFSADKNELKTWILSGWQLDQWLVRTYKGRPKHLKLSRGTLHHGVSHRVKAMYATFYPLGKCESHRAGRLPTGATVLFTMSDKKIFIWKVLRSGPKSMNIDLKMMCNISLRDDCEMFTGPMACKCFGLFVCALCVCLSSIWFFFSFLSPFLSPHHTHTHTHTHT